MKRISLLLFLAFPFALGTGVRADEAESCPEGRAIFGRMSCAGNASAEPLFEAYFYGATTMAEIQSTFPARAAKVGARCRKKFDLLAVGRSPASGVKDELQFWVVPVETCLGRRGYQKPCVRDDDCLEHFCHRERGTCSAVFTVPITAAQ